jgi:hypothetical protein
MGKQSGFAAKRNLATYPYETFLIVEINHTRGSDDHRRIHLGASGRKGSARAGRQKMTYDGGWTRGFAMLLSGTIIGIQIYSAVLAKKK